MDFINVGRFPVGTTTAVQIAAPRPGRKKLVISGSVYIGGDSNVTVATGFSVINEFGNSIMELRDTEAEVWAVASSGTVGVSVLEVFT